MDKTFKLGFFVIFVCLNAMPLVVHGQNSNISNLKVIGQRLQEQQTINDKSVEEYLRVKGLKSRYRNLGNGRIAYLRKVKGGIPYYMATDNSEARTTTGIEQLQSSPGLGSELHGQGIRIAVWDGGRILDSHIEFIGRANNKTFSSPSDHATHVTGTIIAQGVNSRAKGMAPQAIVDAFYGLSNDIPQMADEAADGLILSNHSYGAVLGWSYNSGSSEWEWYGGAEDVDLRFGHYSEDSKNIDEIHYNAPYYLSVWSAGNDRTDDGDGTKPPDGPYNIIGPSASSKNVLTVGAITGFDSYEGPTSAIMSEFSSWGPTSDGRIKPDLVGDGVGVFSTSVNGDSTYTSKNGTSMSAPNVTGSLAILQQYYRSVEDTFMKASELKALAIHSTKEAGRYPGPDVQFGWGVLDAKSALDILIGRNNLDTMISTQVLKNGESFTYNIFSDGITPISATIVWTDIPGTPGALGSTDRMLVNDLDLRIWNDLGAEVFPWAIDLSNPLKAIQQDNDRDNVERINLLVPQPRMYTVTVTHKSILPAEGQEFSLVLTGNSIQSSGTNDLYWIAAEGDAELPENWSLSSGGTSLSTLFLDNSTLVFDENSLLQDNDIIQFNESKTIENLIWLSSKNGIIDLNGDTLSVLNHIRIEADSLKIRNGVLEYVSSYDDVVRLNFDGSENLTFVFDPNSNCTIIDDINVQRLIFKSGSISLLNHDITAQDFRVETEADLLLRGNHINLKDGELNILSSNINSLLNTFNLTNSSLYSASKVELKDSLMLNGNSVVHGELSVQLAIAKGTGSLQTMGRILLDTLILEEDSKLIIEKGDTLQIKDYLSIYSGPNKITELSSNLVSEKSYIKIDYRDQLCFDYLLINDIDVLSQSIFNAGTNSLVNNSSNIDELFCEDIIYPNFTLQSNCSNSVLDVINSSVGSISKYEWTAQKGQILGQTTLASPQFFYEESGDYQIKLEISDGIQLQSYTSAETITPNNLAVVQVVENSNGLVSNKQGDSYQWYLNGEKIEGANERALAIQGSGAYQVAYYLADEACKNRLSESLFVQVTGINDMTLEDPSLAVYPNPFTKMLELDGTQEGDEVTILSIDGVQWFHNKIVTQRVFIESNSMPPGLYILMVKREGKLWRKKILKLG